MKKIISFLVLLCLICGLFPISASASEWVYYQGQNKGNAWDEIYFSDTRTKAALDRCGIGGMSYDKNGKMKANGVRITLQGATIDIYDDLLLENNSDSAFFMFVNGTIRCHDCRAFTMNDDDIILVLENITIINGEADGANYSENGYGGAISVDGKNSVIEGHNCKISNCHAEYGGAISVAGHDCTISGITFSDNKADNNGGTDLYVYWGDCHVNDCTFNSSSPNAYITANTYFSGCNITKEMCTEDVHQVFIYNTTGSVLSEGNLWIVGTVMLAVLGSITVLILVKRRKKPVPADGVKPESENDE